MPRTDVKTQEQLAAERLASVPDTLREADLQRISTGRVRYAISQLAQNNIDKVQDLLDAIEIIDGPKAAFDSLMKILEYSIPKLQRTEVKVEESVTGGAIDNMSVPELEEAIREMARLAVAEERTVVSDQ